MLQYISILLLFLAMCIIYDYTYNKVTIKQQVLISLITILVFIHAKKSKEPFINSKYISSLSNVDNNMKSFCKELSLVDKPSENTLLMRNFKDALINRNNMNIKALNKEIDDYYLNKINTEVSLKHKYKLNQHNTAKKQMTSINMAKNNLINKNSIQLNVK